MEYVRFGRAGLKVSRQGLGTMGIGSSKWKGWVQDRERSVEILKRALDHGINFYDMADWYSNGVNEEIVGATLLGLTRREKLVLATKAFYAISDDPNDQGLSRKHLMASIDQSLKRIGTDYVDLYIIHAFDPDTPIEETMEALNDIVRAGKALHIGASTMYAWQFAKMNHVAERHGWTPFINMQCQYSLLYREEEREMMPYCQDAGIAITTFSPLARGFLATAETTARTEHDIYMKFFGDGIDVEIARRVAEVASARGVTPAHIATAWVAKSPNVTVSLIGADSPAQLDVSIEGSAITLDASEKAFIEEPYRPRDMINDYNPVRRPRAYVPN